MKKNNGFSFIEIMVCVVILSTGLLGLMGLQVRGLKSNVIANQRTQATLLAYNIIDRMRANATEAPRIDPTTKALKANLYVTTVVTNSTADLSSTLCVTPTPTPSNPEPAKCNAQMVTNDLVQWNRELTAQYCSDGVSVPTTLCNGKSLGEITYTAATATVPAFYTVIISWDENRNNVIDNRDPTDPTKSCYVTDTTLPTLPTTPEITSFDPCFRTEFQL